MSQCFAPVNGVLQCLFGDRGADSDEDEDETTGGRPQGSGIRMTKQEKRAARRRSILEELLTSERVYVSCLEVLENVYLLPMRAEVSKRAALSHEDLDIIFFNIEVSHHSVHSAEGVHRISGIDWIA